MRYRGHRISSSTSCSPTTRSRCVMLGLAGTPQGIPRSEYLSHQGWPRKGCRAAGAPDRQTIWILTARGENGDSQSARATSSRCQGGPHGSRWLALTRGFCNVAATITTSLLTLLGRLQFLSRIPDKDLQMPVQFQRVVGVVLAFDELNSLFDW